MKKIILFTVLVCTVEIFGQEKADTLRLQRNYSNSILEDIEPIFSNEIQPQFLQSLRFAEYSQPILEFPSHYTINLPRMNYAPKLNILPTNNLSMYYLLNRRTWINTLHISNKLCWIRRFDGFKCRL